MSLGFIRIETFFRWATDSFGLKVRIHSVWKPCSDEPWIHSYSFASKLSPDELPIHSDWNFGFSGLKTLFGWASDWFGLKLFSDELQTHSDWKFGFSRFKNFVRMSCGFIRIESSDLVGLNTLFGWALDSFDLKLSSDESRIHSDWNFLQMSDGFIRIETSDLVGLKTLFGWASDWFGLKLFSDELQTHSDWKFGCSRFKNFVRMSLGLIRFKTFFGWAADSFGLKLRI